jgi:hypothetical protein
VRDNPNCEGGEDVFATDIGGDSIRSSIGILPLVGLLELVVHGYDEATEEEAEDSAECCVC